MEGREKAASSRMPKRGSSLALWLLSHALRNLLQSALNVDSLMEQKYLSVTNGMDVISGTNGE
jgi:hypothetical protein